jgi:tetratricopeptide (TPR) repeat protein
MPQYEYKVLKIPHVQQTYYCSFMACFGWQVQNIQESVDRVVNRSMGFSNTTNYGSFNANTYFHPHTNSASTYGYSRNRGWGSQMNMQVTDVESSLTITFFRDANIPYLGELNDIEKRFFAATPAYLQRCKQKDRSKENQWPERIAVQTCADQGKAVLARGKQQAQTQTTTQQRVEAQASTSTTSQEQPAPIPSEPPSATIRETEVTHNVFQGNQPGLQIRLNFNIKNRKGIQCRAVTYFFDEKHNPLQDVNQRFQTANGKVSVGSTFKPGFEDCYYNNYILFLPYGELDQKDGDYRLGLNAKVYDEVTKAFLASSPDIFFHYVQNGQSMRGESIATPATKTAIPEPPKTPARTSQKPAPSVKPVTIPERPSFEEYSATFCKSRGWDVLTEDRKVFLQGLEIWYKDFRSAKPLAFHKKALDLNPKEPTYWQWVSSAYSDKLKFDEAIALLQKGLKEIPNDPVLLTSLGYAHIRKMDLDSAQKTADILSTLEERSAKYSYNWLLGMIAETRKDFKTAIQYYDKADELSDPGNSTFLGMNQKRCRELMKQKN